MAKKYREQMWIWAEMIYYILSFPENSAAGLQILKRKTYSELKSKFWLYSRCTIIRRWITQDSENNHKGWAIELWPNHSSYKHRVNV